MREAIMKLLKNFYEESREKRKPGISFLLIAESR
jgi:hypothetical protein